jgi:hypothetical protein
MSWADLNATLARALVDPDAPPPAGLTTARGTPDARRFAVYRNNVHVGLVNALADNFPVVARLVGLDFFRLMARAYVAGTKPASPLLFRYGDGFPDFVAGFAPAAGLPYLADVARLEWAWLAAWQAADVAPLTAHSLIGRAPDTLPALRLLPHPATRLVVSPHPIAAIWHAHQTTEVAPVAVWRGEAVLITRPALNVDVTALAPAEATFAAALLSGATLEDAGLAALEHESGDRRDGAAGADHDPGADPLLDVAAAFDPGRALIGLIAAGAFAGLAADAVTAEPFTTATGRASP